MSLTLMITLFGSWVLVDAEHCFNRFLYRSEMDDMIINTITIWQHVDFVNHNDDDTNNAQLVKFHFMLIQFIIILISMMYCKHSIF